MNNPKQPTATSRDFSFEEQRRQAALRRGFTHIEQPGFPPFVFTVHVVFDASRLSVAAVISEQRQAERPGRLVGTRSAIGVVRPCAFCEASKCKA